jgi:hypothetical protein
MAHGSLELRYSSVVTNILDATHVMLADGYYDFGRMPSNGGLVPLDGIAALEEGSPEEKALLDILEKTLLNKKVYVFQIIDGNLRHVSIYVTDDSRRRTIEDNVNLMLVREGFARYSGRCNPYEIRMIGMIQEAQRLAQEERKGIWATFESTPSPPPAVTNAPAAPPKEGGAQASPPSREEDDPPPPAPVESKPTPWKLPLLIGIVTVIGVVVIWRYVLKKSA